MPTIKNRINITADKDLEKTLKMLAKRDGVPVATKAGNLLRIALELEEDIAWAQVVKERMSEKNIKWISHKTVWKK